MLYQKLVRKLFPVIPIETNGPPTEKKLCLNTLAF